MFRCSKPGLCILSEDGKVYHSPDGDRCWVSGIIQATGGELVPVQSLCHDLKAQHIEIQPNTHDDTWAMEDIRLGLTYDERLALL